MSWRSSTATASSRGTTPNRYGPVPSSLPHTTGSFWSPQDSPSPAPTIKSRWEKAGLSVRPMAVLPGLGKVSPQLGSCVPPAVRGASLAVQQSHPIPATLPSHVSCLADSLLGHLLARQKLGGIFSLLPKQMILLLPERGQGMTLCLLALARVVFSKQCFQRDLLVCQQDRAFHRGGNHYK